MTREEKVKRIAELEVELATLRKEVDIPEVKVVPEYYTSDEDYDYYDSWNSSSDLC